MQINLLDPIVVCEGAYLDNYNDAITLAAAAVGTLAIFASAVLLITLIIKYIRLSPRSFHEDTRYVALMTICQCVADIICGILLVTAPFVTGSFCDYLFWIFAYASVWHLTYIFNRRYIGGRKQPHVDKFSSLLPNQSKSDQLFVCIVALGLMAVGFAVNAAEVRKDRRGGCLYHTDWKQLKTFNILLGLFHTAVFVAVPVGYSIAYVYRSSDLIQRACLRAPRAKRLKVNPNIGAKLKTGMVDMDKGVTVPDEQGPITHSYSTLVTVMIVLIVVMATILRPIWLMIEPLTKDLSVSTNTIYSITLVLAGIKSVSNPLLLWKLHNCCSERTQ